MSQPERGKSITDEHLAQLSINTVRTLSMDAVQRAKSRRPDMEEYEGGPKATFAF